MTPRLIKTDDHYEEARACIDFIFHAEACTPEGDEMELLVKLVELYEQTRFPVSFPDPITAIKFWMEQQGLSQKNLEPFIGTNSKVSEVLSGKRTLSPSMIRKLVDGLGIPVEVLLKQPSRSTPTVENLSLK
jgi:HTH-type transcriptional regulator/antitoxin HigA